MIVPIRFLTGTWVWWTTTSPTVFYLPRTESPVRLPTFKPKKYVPTKPKLMTCRVCLKMHLDEGPSFAFSLYNVRRMTRIPAGTIYELTAERDMLHRFLTNIGYDSAQAIAILDKAEGT